jgi:colicin import membrane protein
MPQSGPVERSRDRWISIVLSVLLHGVLVAAIGYSWWAFKEARPAPTLALDATVVDARSVPGLGNLPPQPQPQPPPPVPPAPPPPPPPETQPQVEPDGPPQPTPEELAKREQEQKEQQEKAEQEAKVRQAAEDQKRLEQERQQEEALTQEKAAEQKRIEEKRLAEEKQQKQAQEKAEAERKAREAAEEKKKEEEKRLAEEKQKQAEQQAAAEREADLKRSLDQELRQDAAHSSAALASWQSQITARIQRAWLRPPSARPGIACVLHVTQVPGGAVTNVSIGSCNGDQAVRQSIEAAVYRASPLPPPPDPALFQRDLEITFRPD